MSEFKKISYFDLRRELSYKKLPQVIGRQQAIERVARVTERVSHNNALIVGEVGIGKTTTLFGLAAFISDRHTDRAVALLYGPDFQGLNSPIVSNQYEEALHSLPAGTYFVDNFGELCFTKPLFLQHFYHAARTMLATHKTQLVITAKPHEYEWLKQADPSFIEHFEVITLDVQTEDEQQLIVQHHAKLLAQHTRVEVSDDRSASIVTLVKKFPQLGTLPKSAISLLDESMAYAAVKKEHTLTAKHIHYVLSEKTGIPLSQFETSELSVLRDLEKNLNQAVRGQAPAMQTITSIIRRAKLGLKNPNRPLGSFLLLGPSGVGKTETAKAVAHHIFGKSERFLRIDMSEFGEAHTVQRLIGAPPGYVGFDVGGEITNTIKQNPYSLLLLDEIEKAHPKIFDIFLQVLDDGRLTSGQGETISFANSIVMATSNIGINEIVAAHEAGDDVSSPGFVRQTLLPLLSQSFRTEFLNRFDAIIAYEPLSEHALLAIAKQEIKKIEQRMSKHDIQFAIKTDVLLERIREHIDPRLGARPIKRFVEDTCETLIANQLLNQH